MAGTFTVEASCTSDSRVTAYRSLSFIIEDVPQKKKKSGPQMTGTKNQPLDNRT